MTHQDRAWLASRYEPDPSTGCWVWTKGRNTDGYGMFTGHGHAPRLAHRAFWEAFVGAIPQGMWVLHHCDNPPCVNPEHLFLGTAQDNARDRDAKRRGRSSRKTHCPQGHPYDDVNTYVTSAGVRQCVMCRRARDANKYAKAAVANDVTQHIFFSGCKP